MVDFKRYKDFVNEYIKVGKKYSTAQEVVDFVGDTIISIQETDEVSSILRYQSEKHLLDKKDRVFYEVLALLSLRPYKKLIVFMNCEKELIKLLKEQEMPYLFNEYSYYNEDLLSDEEVVDIRQSENMLILIPTPEILNKIHLLKEFFGDEENYKKSIANIWVEEYIEKLLHYCKNNNIEELCGESLKGF